MPHPILMPKPGQMTEECTLILWRKAEGDAVQRGDVLFEIETDKSAMEVESWEEGVLLRQVVAEGTIVPVNAICAWVGQPGEAIPDAPPGSVAGTVDALASATVPATAVLRAASTEAAPIPVALPAPPVPVAPVSSGAAGSDGPRLRISPRASRLAADAGIDPRTLTGSGPGGRITERDVQARLAMLSAPSLVPPTMPASTPESTIVVRPSQTHAVAGSETAEPMTHLRRVIAERLTQSWTTTPHFTVTVPVNMYRLLNLRAALKLSGTILSVTDLVLNAVAQTLVEFPDLNSRVDGATVIRHPRVHLGLAVSVPGGLLVPVIRDADLLSVTGIHQRTRELVAGARDGSLRPDELSGSTFTVSNLGMFEVDEFSAIINPGEAAILAVASAVPTPVAVGEGIAVRPIMKLTLSADHRVVDGETGARFLGALRRRLEDAESFRHQALLA